MHYYNSAEVWLRKKESCTNVVGMKSNEVLLQFRASQDINAALDHPRSHFINVLAYQPAATGSIELCCCLA